MNPGVGFLLFCLLLKVWVFGNNWFSNFFFENTYLYMLGGSCDQDGMIFFGNFLGKRPRAVFPREAMTFHLLEDGGGGGHVSEVLYLLFSFLLNLLR